MNYQQLYTLLKMFLKLFNFLQTEYPGPRNVIVIEYDNITMKTKLDVRSGIVAIRFDEKSFFL